ncbi:uncharacterized protein LOC121370055 [Gigantopelta aegis]|uniref:uncharacterized protein LOC121370055 n=1 Tax=Gigantopelta aegis TaxID=1735272 RepID=UPI001B88DA82|nr:uncharacterized protein LOC121370055 [Gigantopelta aegis]
MYPSRNCSNTPVVDTTSEFGREVCPRLKKYRPFTPPPPRERLSYTRFQLELLNGIYGRVRYPNSTQKQLIAKRVGITREQVKIWFQNRRRKDVVGTGGKEKGPDDRAADDEKVDEKSSEDAEKPEEAMDTSKDKDDDKNESDSEQVLPPLVMKSVIAELMKFEKDPLKNKKKKKKRPSRSNQAAANAAASAAAAAAKLGTSALFQHYDMVNPPNKVTPSAFLNTAGNRFNHSKNTSAFHNPRTGFLKPGQMMFAAQPSYLGAFPGGTMPSSVSVLPNDFLHPQNAMNCPPSNVHHQQSGTPSMYESIPVLADLLSYRSGLDPKHTKEQTLPQSSLPLQCSMMSPARTSENSYVDISGGPCVPSAPLGFNRMFPFPFIADPPVMLSAIRQQEPHRPQPHVLPPPSSDDTYQPLAISSLTNPYFNPSSTASWHSPETLHPNTYTQL